MLLRIILIVQKCKALSFKRQCTKLDCVMSKVVATEMARNLTVPYLFRSPQTSVLKLF